MPVIKVTPEIHKRLMDDRNSKNVRVSDVIEDMYRKIDTDGCSWKETYKNNRVSTSMEK